MSDNIARLRELAEAATPGPWAEQDYYFTVNGRPVRMAKWDSAFIAANDPATIEAFCEMARAYDPEPPISRCREVWYGEPTQHIAWRKRQDARNCLEAALRKE